MPSPNLADHHRRLAAMYAEAPINRLVPCRATIGDGEAEVHMDVSEDHWHAAGALHGSIYFKGLDDAAFFAANSVVPDVFVLTARFEIELLAPVTGSSLRAVGKLDSRNGKKLEASATLYADDQVVARGKGLFIASSVALDDVPAYRNSKPAT
jgi:acyl-coenzyme A thioesterase PaaI-like protein